VDTQGPKHFAVLGLPDFQGRTDQNVIAWLVRHANLTRKLVVTDPASNAEVGEVKHGLDLYQRRSLDLVGAGQGIDAAAIDGGAAPAGDDRGPNRFYSHIIVNGSG
jgi:hypothetical protein